MNKKFIHKNKKIYIAGLIVLGCILMAFIFMTGLYIHFLNTPADKNGPEASFTVTSGDGVRKVASDLDEAAIISYDFPFLVYLKFSGLSSSIQAGDYKLSATMSPKMIAEILTKGRVDSKKITIPEGWTIEDIGTYLEKEGVVTKSDFLASARQNYDYDFLADKPAGQSLEGYLFPDTYQISNTTDADSIVKLMLDNFGQKLTSQIRASIDDSGKSIYEIVSLASVVEREVSKPEDRKLVAGVFWNRLTEGMALESCATIQYILKSDKPRFSYEETRVESPYNTYINPGLPVGPIGNPGIDSINAVLKPEKSDYVYFFSAEGVTYYSKTLDEHEEKNSKIPRLGCLTRS
jgi:UPF0755 protein